MVIRWKKSKQVFLIWLACTLLILSACGQNNANRAEQNESVTIAVSTIGLTHAWASGVYHYAQAETEKVAQENNWHYELVVANSSNEQSSQIIELIEKNVDCIVMLPMDGAALKTAAKAVQKAGIPLVIFDREVPDFAPTATVKGDNPGMGVKAAEIFNEAFPEGTKVLELMGDASTVTYQRSAGFDSTINDNITKIQLGYTDWKREKAIDFFREWAQTTPQEDIDTIEGIYSHDDLIALGILDVLDELRMSEEYSKTFNNLKLISGASGSQVFYQRMLKEDTYELFTLTYPPDMIVQAIRIGESIIKGENYEEMLIVPTDYVDKHNMDEYLNSSSPF